MAASRGAKQLQKDGLYGLPCFPSVRQAVAEYINWSFLHRTFGDHEHNEHSCSVVLAADLQNVLLPARSLSVHLSLLSAKNLENYSSEIDVTW